MTALILMSDLPPQADIDWSLSPVRLGPIGDKITKGSLPESGRGIGVVSRAARTEQSRTALAWMQASTLVPYESMMGSRA